MSLSDGLCGGCRVAPLKGLRMPLAERGRGAPECVPRDACPGMRAAALDQPKLLHIRAFKAVQERYSILAGRQQGSDEHE